ncbi:hypothetical protein ACFSC4_25575 [Deinococcus malanensis]|uniref:hypothetical protein n=1 Tax=Deinococcus malanensis TaxID=1706855 RepID=UPI0036272D7F
MKLSLTPARLIAVAMALLVILALHLAGPLGVGAAIFLALLSFAGLWTGRQYGTYRFDLHTTPLEVAMHTGTAPGARLQ